MFRFSRSLKSILRFLAYKENICIYGKCKIINKFKFHHKIFGNKFLLDFLRGGGAITNIVNGGTTMKKWLEKYRVNIKYIIVGVIMFVLAIILLPISGTLSEVNEGFSTFIAFLGVLLLIVAIASFGCFFLSARDFKKTHCDECDKLLTGCEYTIRHISSETKMQQNGQKSVKVHYVVTCKCPYCGNEDTWEGTSAGSSLEKAMVNAEKYVKNLYRKTTHTYPEFIKVIENIKSGEEFELNDEFLSKNYLQLKPD